MGVASDLAYRNESGINPLFWQSGRKQKSTFPKMFNCSLNSFFLVFFLLCLQPAIWQSVSVSCVTWIFMDSLSRYRNLRLINAMHTTITHWLLCSCYLLTRYTFHIYLQVQSHHVHYRITYSPWKAVTFSHTSQDLNFSQEHYTMFTTGHLTFDPTGLRD